MKATGSKNIKDYKINTRILYCHKRHQTPQFEAIISEFSDSGEYVCLEHSPNKTNDWYKVADIIVLDTLKNKQTPVDEVSYEQQEADAIEKECEEYEITKDTMIFYDEVDQKMTEEDWNSFGEYHLSAESYNEWLKKKEKAQEELQKLEVYPSDVIHGKNKPTYFLEIYNGERWKLCLRAELNLSIPKLGWSSGEVHPYTLGEGKIAHEYLINMYTLSNLKRIVDGLNMQNAKESSPLFPPSFEPLHTNNPNWQKNYPHPITTSP